MSVSLFNVSWIDWGSDEILKLLHSTSFEKVSRLFSTISQTAPEHRRIFLPDDWLSQELYPNRSEPVLHLCPPAGCWPGWWWWDLSWGCGSGRRPTSVQNPCRRKRERLCSLRCWRSRNIFIVKTFDVSRSVPSRPRQLELNVFSGAVNRLGQFWCCRTSSVSTVLLQKKHNK